MIYGEPYNEQIRNAALVALMMRTARYRNEMADFIDATVAIHKAAIALQAKQNREHINRSLGQHTGHLAAIRGGGK